MYPIQRQDYINAYIGAISEEIRECRAHADAEAKAHRNGNRFYQIVAEKLNSWCGGVTPPARPLSTH